MLTVTKAFPPRAFSQLSRAVRSINKNLACTTSAVLLMIPFCFVPLCSVAFTEFSPKLHYLLRAMPTVPVLREHAFEMKGHGIKAKKMLIRNSLSSPPCAGSSLFVLNLFSASHSVLDRLRRFFWQSSLSSGCSCCRLAFMALPHDPTSLHRSVAQL